MTHSFLDRLAYTISAKSRARKHVFFLQKIQPQNNETILDVGVNAQEYSDTDNYLEHFYPHPEKITAVSLEDTTSLQQKYPAITFVKADGTKLPFENNQFDIVYSNAVIEHVGNTSEQKQFLQELIRVGKRGYLTTPNRYFPIEVHTRVPLLHLLLSKKSFDRFLKSIGKGWAADNYMHLLSYHDLESLMGMSPVSQFYIYRNTFFGFTMTLTLIWKK